MRQYTRPAAGLSWILLVFSLVIGCRQEVPPLFRPNQPPETTLTVIPEDSTQGFYSYHVYWHGTDSDGRVVRYIFAITDTISRTPEDNWDPQRAEDRERSFYTEKTDSVFIFDSARGRQTFNISAIDDHGRLDRTPARAFFRIVDNGLPRVEFLSVRTSRADIAPCAGALPCTIPAYTNFRVSFRGTTRNNRITGFQWQGIRPGEIDPEPFQPLGADSLYLDAGRDTTAVEATGDTLWTLRGDVVTVFYRNVRADSIEHGNFSIRARVRDEANLVSLISSGARRVVLNYDPDTRFQRMSPCDCPKPPPNCGSRDSVAVGWVVGVDQIEFTDPAEWLRFCPGDTVPQLSHLRFFARGSDDRRDEPMDPDAGRRDVGFSYRFEWTAGEGDDELRNSNMPFSEEYAAADYVLPPPFGTPWHGGFHGWGQDSQGACPFNFTFFVSAVDEHGKRDGTPDSLSFFVGGNPVLDSISVPKVLVFVPTCPPGFASFCPDLNTMAPFGPDTVVVQGVFEPGPPPGFPLVFGSNRFTFPFLAWGHDDRRDRNPLRNQNVFESTRDGRIRAWRFTFDCLGSNCQDILIPGEGVWRADRDNQDPPGQQAFDDALQIPLALDTLCTSPPGAPCFGTFKMSLPEGGFDRYLFTLQGRDAEAQGQTCTEPSDLGSSPSSFPRPVSGRTTQLFQQPVVLLQLQTVRRYVPAPTATAFGVQKRLMP